MAETAQGAGPLVSVAMPVRNGVDTVAEAIRSVLAQTYRPVELIVVDDGSTDGTWAVLEGFGGAIRALRQENQGIAAARNAGLRAARGDLIALMDADDLCEPERIAVGVRYLAEHPEVVLCSSDFSAFSASGPIAASYIGTYYHQCSQERGGVAARYPERGTLDIRDCVLKATSAPADVPAYQGDVYDELALGNFVHPPTVLFRRELLDTVGGFDPAIRIMCEWDWLVRVARVGAIGFVDRPMLRYRLSESQVSSSEAAAMDSVQVARMIVARDPALVARHRKEFRHLLGGLYADAADAEADHHHRWAGLRHLATSVVRYHAVSGRTLRTLAKLALPTPLLELLRQVAESLVLLA